MTRISDRSSKHGRIISKTFLGVKKKAKRGHRAKETVDR